MGQESIFTKIVKKQIPAHIIYEDKNTIAFLDIKPFEKGHTLVVPKKQYTTIMDMPETEFLELCSVVYKIAKHFETELNCGINVWQNNKEIAGQEVMHVHFHVVPRLDKSKKTYLHAHKEEYLENEAANYARRLKL